MKSQRRELIAGLLFISPWIIGFLAFTIYPIIQSFRYSLSDYNVFTGVFTFAGLKNYQTMLTDRTFQISLTNTLYTVFVGVTASTVVALALALLMDNKRLKGQSIFRVVFFIPTLMPLIISCILWMWILQPDYGLINSLLRLFGATNPPGWLSSPVWAKPAMILMMVWGCGGSIIIYLAGLQDVPQSLYESASLDGANFMQRTFHITIPIIAPVMLYNVVTAVIGVFQWFAEPQVMTQGGPNQSTLFYSLYLYQNAFQFNKMSYASAMAWVLLVICLIIIFFLFKGLNRFSDN
ncbi:sugar ABC transporter permease [Eubacteriales bacterium OttesenSCG-928-N13]|nr:sugar ABC transporter permease [Eubacteriales bacterium OttesenSCG-928-N13]